MTRPADPLVAIKEAMDKLPDYYSCMVCAAPLLPSRHKCGTCQRCADYLDGVKDGIAAGAWKATLERDVAEVERVLIGWRQSLAAIARKDADDPTDWPRLYRGFAAKVADCEAWLGRARAALGGDR